MKLLSYAGRLAVYENFSSIALPSGFQCFKLNSAWNVMRNNFEKQYDSEQTHIVCMFTFRKRYSILFRFAHTSFQVAKALKVTRNFFLKRSEQRIA